MTITKWTVPVLGLLLCCGTTAQADDATYCKALAQQYERYVVKIDSGHSVQRGSTGASVALEQCRNGNALELPVHRSSPRADVPAGHPPAIGWRYPRCKIRPPFPAGGSIVRRHFDAVLVSMLTT